MANSSFTVLPMSQRFSLEPGKTYTGKISVINPADATEDFVYNISVSPYSVVGSDYTADLATTTNRTEIVKWIKIKEPTGRIKPNETKEVEFSITVPENAAGGGQYAAIAISSDVSSNGADGLAINNIFELASLVYADVAGDVVHAGEITSNNVPGFVTSVPIKLSAIITNEGNVHEDATFVIKVTNAFTGEVILPTEDNNGQFNELIMPETTRDIERNLDNLPGIGVVKVSQVIYYQGEVSVVEKDVVICPIWFMAIVALVIAAIAAAITGIVMKSRRKKSKQAVL